jgi:hypothetical protein
MLALAILPLGTLLLQAAEPPPASSTPVSVERVRAGLERPATLIVDLPAPAATFRVEITKHPYFTELPPLDFGTGPRGPDLPDWIPHQPLPQVGSAPPVAGVDLLALARAVHRKWAAERRAGAERAAREEVQRALQEFCATTGSCERQ